MMSRLRNPLRRRLTLSAGIVVLLAGCGGGSDTDGNAAAPSAAARDVLYVQSNDRRPGRNSVLAYARAADGSLAPLAGSPFLIGGTGHNNPTAGKLGPNDNDQPMVATTDRRRMFAVNAGSNTIAVLNIGSDGSLTPVAGSPFPSGGRNPVSVEIAGNRLYVVNKNEDSDQLPNNDLPNYTGFTIGSDGRLTPIPNSTVPVIKGGSPTQVLASRDGRLIFGADFLAPVAQPGIGSLRSFRLATDGTLTSAPGSPMALPAGPNPPPPLPLGLWLHPTQDILYAGFVTRSQLGVYTYDATSGALTFAAAVPNSGKEICWVRTNASGTRLYTVNNIDASVSFYDNSNPLRPLERQKLVLKELGPMFLNDRGPDSFMQVTSTPFQPALDPSERFLYVVSQRSDATHPAVVEGNKLHTLAVAADGTVSQPGAPLDLPVPADARPMGLVVF